MNLHQLFLTENACYKTYRKHTVKGIMVHSTGANNPWLKRYIGPDDGLLGVNQYGNHWNTYHPGDREVCVHGFIGKLKDGTIATYQTLPWEICGWHSGSGSKGNANFLGYVGFEICEDDLTDANYFNKVYKEAIELCVYLCKKYGLTEKNIICHCEGHQQGIASNHGDVMHWFPKHGKSMDTFRAEVKKLLAAEEKPAEPAKPTTPTTPTTTKIGEGAKVEIKASATTYNPESKTIPAWVKGDYYHIVTQVTYKGKPVVKGGKTCVLLGKKVKKNGTAEEAGINTWVAIDNLSVVGAKATTPTYKVHTVVKGDTLWAIAQKYLGNGARYTEIMTLNGLKTTMIHSGDKLNIPNK